MTLKKVSIVLLVLLFIFMQPTYICLAEELKDSNVGITITGEDKPILETNLAVGEVTTDNINVRSDSTTNSEIICQVNKGEYLEIITELYGWYKIRLPEPAPAFVKKDFILPAANGSPARVLKDNINVRLRADLSSPILGKLNKDERVNILGESRGWYRIEPNKNSTGWIHKNFVKKLEKKEIKIVKNNLEKNERIVYDHITVEGLIKPKTFTRIATHKLIAQNYKVYLLKGAKEDLTSFNYRRVKITGRLIDPSKQKYPIIEVVKIEALD